MGDERRSLALGSDLVHNRDADMATLVSGQRLAINRDAVTRHELILIRFPRFQDLTRDQGDNAGPIRTRRTEHPVFSKETEKPHLVRELTHGSAHLAEWKEKKNSGGEIFCIFCGHRRYCPLLFGDMSADEVRNCLPQEGDDEDVAREMIRRNGLDVTRVNELGNEIRYTVQRIGTCVRVVVKGPTSTCDHTWTRQEFDELAGLFDSYNRFLQDEERESDDDEMPGLCSANE